jgi:hypothetical protein
MNYTGPALNQILSYFEEAVTLNAAMHSIELRGPIDRNNVKQLAVIELMLKTLQERRDEAIELGIKQYESFKAGIHIDIPFPTTIDNVASNKG